MSRMRLVALALLLSLPACNLVVTRRSESRVGEHVISRRPDRAQVRHSVELEGPYTLAFRVVRATPVVKEQRRTTRSCWERSRYLHDLVFFDLFFPPIDFLCALIYGLVALGDEDRGLTAGPLGVLLSPLPFVTAFDTPALANPWTDPSSETKVEVQRTWEDEAIAPLAGLEVRLDDPDGPQRYESDADGRLRLTLARCARRWLALDQDVAMVFTAGGVTSRWTLTRQQLQAAVDRLDLESDPTWQAQQRELAAAREEERRQQDELNRLQREAEAAERRAERAAERAEREAAKRQQAQLWDDALAQIQRTAEELTQQQRERTDATLALLQQAREQRERAQQEAATRRAEAERERAERAQREAEAARREAEERAQRDAEQRAARQRRREEELARQAERLREEQRERERGAAQRPSEPERSAASQARSMRWEDEFQDGVPRSTDWLRVTLRCKERLISGVGTEWVPEFTNLLDAPVHFSYRIATKKGQPTTRRTHLKPGETRQDRYSGVDLPVGPGGSVWFAVDDVRVGTDDVSNSYRYR